MASIYYTDGSLNSIYIYPTASSAYITVTTDSSDATNTIGGGIDLCTNATNYIHLGEVCDWGIDLPREFRYKPYSNWGIDYANYGSIDVTGTVIYDLSFTTRYMYIPSPVETKKWKIKEQLTIHVKSRAQEIKGIPLNEWTAMQTLRDMITETEFRKYIKYGFVSVKGKSGKVYQIFRNKWHTKVYLKGELIEEICVRLKNDMPPTDNVIAFKTMIETDEEYFESLGNRYNMRKAA